MVDQNELSPKACFVYGSLRPDDDSGQLWTQKACLGMCARKAKVKGAQLFKDSYAVAVLEKEGHHVIGNVLTCELSDTTKIGSKDWKEMKQFAMKAGGLEQAIGDEEDAEELINIINEHIEEQKA